MSAEHVAMDAGLPVGGAIEDTRLAFEQMILDNHAGRAEIVARAPDGSYKFMAAESAWVVWKAAARWALDQAQATDDGVVRAFEHWYSDEGAWPAAVERRGGQYVLSQANSAWGVWRAGAVWTLEGRQALREPAGDRGDEQRLAVVTQRERRHC